MDKDKKIISIIPVLPSSDIKRDIAWYRDKAGFDLCFGDDKYVGMGRGAIEIHLQWHADTEDDPLMGGSVVRIFVSNIRPYFEEFILRNTIEKEKLKLNTAWGTNEFGFYDPNGNAIFIVEDL